MPSETFYKLSNEKKNKILNSAKKEFSRVPFEETSIKNIVDDAHIARGSFYQYFKDKEDLLFYIIRKQTEKMNNTIEINLKESNGDIFNLYIIIYDFMVENFTQKDEAVLFKRIFENIKASDEKIFTAILQNYKPNQIEDYYNLIDKRNLKIKSKEDLKIITKILNTVTKNAVLSTFSSKSKQQARKDFLQELDYIKYGVIKQK